MTSRGLAARMALPGLLAAASASAGIVLTAEPAAPGSPDVLIRWEAEGRGPFSLLSRDFADGTALTFPPSLVPDDAVLSDLPAGSVLWPGGALLPAGSDLRVFRLEDQSDGSCSNFGYVALRRDIRAGTSTILGLPGRTSVRALSDVLALDTNVARAELPDPQACRTTVLERQAGGASFGLDAFIPEGRAPTIVLGRDSTLTIVGASDPRRRATIARLGASCDLEEQVSLPVFPVWDEAGELLCGPSPDANRDGVPDTCDAGLWDGGSGMTIRQVPRHDEPVGRARSVRTHGGTMLVFSGQDFTLDAFAGHGVRQLVFADQERRLDNRDRGSPTPCRCADGDGDGDDDCAERLFGTDPADPASHGPDADRDGVRDDDDACPVHADPAQENADGDEFGDACDPDALDPANAVVDADLDGVLDGRDLCPFVPDPLQADRDGDRFGDACDACPDEADSQADSDLDGLGNACDTCPLEATPDLDGDGECAGDNCPRMPNPGQQDSDGDGFGDACECAERPVGDPWLGLRVDAFVPAPELFRRLSWPEAPPLPRGSATVYDLLVGPLDEIAAGRGRFDGAQCLASGVPTASFLDGPRSGGAWYLVRKRTACAVTSWGSGTVPSHDPRGELDARLRSECP